MKKIVFFLALFSFSMGCFAQKYKNEYYKLKSYNDSLSVLLLNLKNENKNKEDELNKLKESWKNICGQSMAYAAYLSAEDFDILIAQTDSFIDGKELIENLILAKNNRDVKSVKDAKFTIDLKQPTSEETSTSTIIVEGDEVNHSEEDEFTIDGKEGANSTSNLIGKSHLQGDLHSPETSINKKVKGDINNDGKKVKN